MPSPARVPVSKTMSGDPEQTLVDVKEASLVGIEVKENPLVMGVQESAGEKISTAVAASPSSKASGEKISTAVAASSSGKAFYFGGRALPFGWKLNSSGLPLDPTGTVVTSWRRISQHIPNLTYGNARQTRHQTAAAKESTRMKNQEANTKKNF